VKGGVIVTGIGLVVTTVFAPVVILVGTFAGLAVASVVRGPMVSDPVFDQANGIPSEYLGEPVTVPVQVDAKIEVTPAQPVAEPADTRLNPKRRSRLNLNPPYPVLVILAGGGAARHVARLLGVPPRDVLLRLQTTYSLMSIRRLRPTQPLMRMTWMMS